MKKKFKNCGKTIFSLNEIKILISSLNYELKKEKESPNSIKHFSITSKKAEPM